MSTASIASTGIQTAQAGIAKTANNIANSNTDGFKRGLSEKMNIRREKGVYAIDRNTIDIKGSVESTGIVTDLATSDNKGFFIVKDNGSGEVLNLVTGSFRLNNKKELEALDKYVLLGTKYNGDSDLNQRFEPIVIDSNTLSDPKATKNIVQSFNLNSALLPKEQTSFLMTLNNGKGNELRFGDGFGIGVEEEKDGQLSSSYLRCVFGTIRSQEFNNSGTDLVSSANFADNDALDINWNGIQTSIKFKDLKNLSNNSFALKEIGQRLTDLGLKSEVSPHGTDSSMLSIQLPDNNDNDSISISGKLAEFLNIKTYTVSEPNTVRFSSISDLHDKLSERFSSISKSDTSILFISQPNSRVTMSNLDDKKDVLKTLNMHSASRYDPYDSSSNMSSGNMLPDVLRTVTLYDSLGNQHVANIALKRVEDGWMQEVYFPDANKLKGVRPDGLVQVTKFKFNSKGQLAEAEKVIPPVTTSAVADPFTPVDLQGRSLITIGTQSFPTAPGSMSLVDLAHSINKTQNLGVEATVFRNAQGQYQLKLISQTSTMPSVTGGVLTTNTFNQLRPATQELNITFKAKVDPLNISFDYLKMRESAHSSMFGEVDADGAAPSTLSDISISPNGDVVGRFADGSTKKLYRIPLATYANVNGLEAAGDNALRATSKSGRMVTFNPGEGPVGEILSGNKEASNVNIEEELTHLVQDKQFYNVNVQAWKTGNGIVDYLLSAVNI